MDPNTYGCDLGYSRAHEAAEKGEKAMAMSAEHKAALAAGRRQSRAIKNYLEALGARRPGRPVTPESLAKKIEDLGNKIAAETNPLKAIDLRQSRLDAQAALAKARGASDLAELEADFVAHAAEYGARKGISYAAWREAGVPAAVLKKAGIGRGA